MNKFFEFILILIFIIPILTLSTLIAILILIFDGRPILYKQIRVGKHWKKFKIYKFRTMKINKFKNMDFTGKNITSLGKILRKSKLDELPQLINVFKNEMALIGPRPEIPENFLQKHKNEWNKILKIKPGITDLASIEFRNEEMLLKKSKNPKKMYLEKILPKKLILNKKYIDNKGIYLDIRIIIKTFLSIILK